MIGASRYFIEEDLFEANEYMKMLDLNNKIMLIKVVNAHPTKETNIKFVIGILYKD